MNIVTPSVARNKRGTLDAVLEVDPLSDVVVADAVV